MPHGWKRPIDMGASERQNRTVACTKTPLEAIYRRLPIPLQQVACSIQGFGKARVRLGSTFARKLEELSVSEWWSKSEIAAYQDEKLRGLIRHPHQGRRAAPPRATGGGRREARSTADRLHRWNHRDRASLLLVARGGGIPVGGVVASPPALRPLARGLARELHRQVGGAAGAEASPLLAMGRPMRQLLFGMQHLPRRRCPRSSIASHTTPSPSGRVTRR